MLRGGKGAGRSAVAGADEGVWGPTSSRRRVALVAQPHPPPHPIPTTADEVRAERQKETKHDAAVALAATLHEVRGRAGHGAGRRPFANGCCHRLSLTTASVTLPACTWSRRQPTVLTPNTQS
jgi:hypothetical protein